LFLKTGAKAAKASNKAQTNPELIPEFKKNYKT
jgi:hypothetical protein